MHHITNQQTCLDYVVASLAPEFATEVRDFLLAPPNTDPYSVLKAQLIQRTVALEQRRLQHCGGSQGQESITTFAPDATTAG